MSKLPYPISVASAVGLYQVYEFNSPTERNRFYIFVYLLINSPYLKFFEYNFLQVKKY
jgi:hypothetical protein